MSASSRMFTCSLGGAEGRRPGLELSISWAAASLSRPGRTSLAGLCLGKPRISGFRGGSIHRFRLGLGLGLARHISYFHAGKVEDRAKNTH